MVSRTGLDERGEEAHEDEEEGEFAKMSCTWKDGGVNDGLSWKLVGQR